MNKHRGPDFGENNVFTYIYQPKVHKSHALREKNEKIISLIADQFTEKNNDDQLAKMAALHMKEKNKRDEKI